MSRLFIERLVFMNTETRSSESLLNEWLAKPPQHDVVAIQYIQALYYSGEDMIAMKPASHEYLITRKSA